MLVACQNDKAIEVDPTFYNYTNDQIVEFNKFYEVVNQKDEELDYSGLNYENNSYQIKESYQESIITTYTYSNSEIKEKTLLGGQSSFIYNHVDGVINDLYYNEATVEANNRKIITDDSHDYYYGLYNQKIVKADNNSYLYEELANVADYLTFGGYTKSMFSLSNTAIEDNVNDFVEYNQPDISTKYYINNNILTTGIVYNDKEQSVISNLYKDTLSVSAVCQIVVNNKNITISTEYTSTEIESNYTSEYAKEFHIPYLKKTVVTTYKSIKTITIGGEVETKSANLKNYSLVNSSR